MAFKLQNFLLEPSFAVVFLSSLVDLHTTKIRSVWDAEHPTEKGKERNGERDRSSLQKHHRDHTEMFCHHRTPMGNPPTLKFNAVST